MDTTESSSIISAVTAELIKDTVKSIFSSTKKIWHSSKLKSELELEKVFQDYIEYAYNQNKYIKTLLYKNVGKPLYNFYEPVHVKLDSSSIKTDDIISFFGELGTKVIITGSGGIGKSTLIKHFFLNSIDRGYKIPLLIELRNLNTKVQLDNEFNLTNYLFEVARSNKFETDYFYFQYALEQGRILILFDGLDELDGNNNKFIENEIRNFSKHYNNLSIIVSSRPSDQFIGWHEFKEVKAQNLNKQQALSLISKLELENEVAKQNFYELLDGEFYKKYESFASIPLLLTIMLLTYEMNASIPDNLNDFYEMAFLALFQTHDASKSSFTRDMKSKLNYEDFKEVFCHMSFNSFYYGEYNFTEASLLEYIGLALKQNNLSGVTNQDYLRDLQDSVCMIFKDGFRFTFTHRSFQEYFAAVFISKQNDEVQETIFKHFINNEHRNPSESIFFGALKTMQPNRYKKNFLFAIAKDYKNYSYTDLFKELIFRFRYSNSDPYGTTIQISNYPLWVVQREVVRIEKRKLLRQPINFEDFPFFIDESEDTDHVIDIEKLEKENRLEEFIKVIDGRYVSISYLLSWIARFENEYSKKDTPITDLLGLKQE